MTHEPRIQRPVRFKNQVKDFEIVGVDIWIYLLYYIINKKKELK